MLGKSVSKVILFFRDDLVGRSISKLDLVPDRKWISKQDLINSGVALVAQFLLHEHQIGL